MHSTLVLPVGSLCLIISSSMSMPSSLSLYIPLTLPYFSNQSNLQIHLRIKSNPFTFKLEALVMKRLIRRLSRVADASSHYCLLRSDTSSGHRSMGASLKKRSVPEGHVPIYVGEEMELFVVKAELLNHPVFIALLDRSAREYGYHQKGVLHIPCHVLLFERVLEACRLGVESRHLQDLLGSFPDDCVFDY